MLIIAQDSWKQQSVPVAQLHWTKAMFNVNGLHTMLVVWLLWYTCTCVQKKTLFLFHWSCLLKAVDTICSCQRLAFTVCVSQHSHKITNLWKFELDWSLELRDNYERKKRPCHTKLCAFRWLISRPQNLILRSRNKIYGKLLLSRKLRHFRGSRFSQCFIPSTSSHYSSPRKVLC